MNVVKVQKLMNVTSIHFVLTHTDHITAHVWMVSLVMERIVLI